MLPGLVLEEPVTPDSFGNLPKDAPVSIDTKNNKVWIFRIVCYSIMQISNEKNKAFFYRLRLLSASRHVPV
jgi:hypothetical protein